MFHQPVSHENVSGADPTDPGASLFWTTLLAAFDLHDVRYCALHAHGPLLYESDFAVHPGDQIKLGRVFSELRPVGYRAVQSGQTCPGGYRIIFARSDSQVEFVSLDLVFRVSSGDRTLSAATLTAGRQRSGLVWIPDPAAALAPEWRTVPKTRVGEGAFLVFLGPDGVGKTTLLAEVGKSLAPLFAHQNFFRWRPAIFARAPRPSALPHSKPLRTAKGSLLYLLFLWLDFVSGYFFRTRQMLRRGELVLCDRYYHDLLIDPKRYRYSRPLWLVKLVSHIVPPRDAFFIVLDADENTIFARKQQLPLEEIRRQRKAYTDFSRTTPLSVLVATDKTLEQCRAIALAALLRYFADRTAKRNPAWFGGVAQAGPEDPIAVTVPGPELFKLDQ